MYVVFCSECLNFISMPMQTPSVVNVRCTCDCDNILAALSPNQYGSCQKREKCLTKMGVVAAGREVTWDLGLQPLNDLHLYFLQFRFNNSRSQWPRGLRRRSAAARLLRSSVRIPPGAWMFVCCEYCVLSGRGLCDELITRPEESYRLWCVVCDL